MELRSSAERQICIANDLRANLRAPWKSGSVTRRGAYFTVFVLVLAALATPIVLRSDMSGGGKVFVISLGTVFLFARTLPWRLK